MGCDIHMFAEHRRKNAKYPQWDSLTGSVNPGRNYYIFGLMSKGVRQDIEDAYPARGLPDDISYQALEESRIYIHDELAEQGNEEYCTLAKAHEWEKWGHKIHETNGKPDWIEHPDWHSHSWLTLEEFRTVLKRFKKQAKKDGYDANHEVEYFALLAALEKLEELGRDTRVVFWFDN